MSIWDKLFGRKKKRSTSDSPELIKKNIADGLAIMLDVRGQEERDAGCLADSLFIPITAIKELSTCSDSEAADLLKDLPKDKIIYCH